MDSKQRWYGCYFDTDRQLTNFLSKARSTYEKHTKFIELERAFFFKVFLDFDTSRVHLVGIPTLDDSVEKRRCVWEEILDRKIAFDEDFDIVIAPKDKLDEKVKYLIQIVRFTGNVSATTESLLDFLKKKKFNIPRDRNIWLLVVVEADAFQLKYSELNRKLSETNVPYGKIFILGTTQSPRILFCCEVFPLARLLGKIDFNTLRYFQ
jgi:hypothetical protein